MEPNPAPKVPSMRHKTSITVLTGLIIMFAGLAASVGIFSSDGTGPYPVTTVRGHSVTVYGNGIYKHMSQDVAPQGIAQDYVTLFVAIPLLAFALFRARRGSLKGRFLLTGILGYFMVTYLFYLVMAMYNLLFPVYTILLATSFFAFALAFRGLSQDRLYSYFGKETPVTVTGGFLIFNSLIIAFLWLSVVVPPLLDGSIIPVQVEHYTTLIVQGLDLGLLLPLSFLSGLLLIHKKPMGYLMGPVYIGFLSLMMTALTAKVIAMGLLGQKVIPAIIIIPIFNIIAIACMILLLRHLQQPGHV